VISASSFGGVLAVRAYADDGTTLGSGMSGGITVTGSGGADSMIGGDGNDRVVIGEGNDTVDGNAGTDTVSFAGRAIGVSITLNTSTAVTYTPTGGSAIGSIVDVENLIGTSFNDTLTGDSAANSISGGSGNDTIAGGTGADTITSGGGNDTITIAAGDSAPTIGGTGNSGTVTGFDVITDLTTGTTAASKDLANLPGTPVLAASSTGTNGTDSTLTIGGSAVKSHAISAAGVVTFGSTDVYSGSALLVATSDAELAALVQYLMANDIGAAGASVVINATYASATRGSVTHSFIYNQLTANAATAGNSGDGAELIDLVGVAAAGLETTASTTDLIPYIG